jgi:hypothetical protein
MVKAMTKISEHQSKEMPKPESKPEKLAKILYGAIVRYIRAQSAPIGEKNAKFELDFSRERRVNVHTKNIDN